MSEVEEERQAPSGGLGAQLLGPRALTTALALAALAALLAWSASPYARYLHHEYEPATAGGQAAAIALFLAGWLLMSAATMLPTTTALVDAFDARLAQADLHTQRDAGAAAPSVGERARPRLLLVAGFLAVWLLVGYLFRALDVLVHAAVDGVGWLGARSGLVAAATLALAGAYQFAPLKRRSLRACHAPRALLADGWSDGRPIANPLRIGIAYGRACVGSCWALMLVMFGLGMAHLALMLGLATLVGAEQLASTRLRLRAAAGVALLGASALIALCAVT